MSGVVFEIDEGGEAKVVGPATAEQVIQAAPTAEIITDDPLAGLEDLRRQVETKDRERLDAENRARNEANARQEADRRAAAAQEETRRAQAVADSNGYDSVVNALALTEREMTSLQSLKASAFEKGDYEKVATYDAQMSKVGARSVQLETAKSQIERTRQNAAPAQQQQQQPVLSQQDQNDAFLRNLPTQSADWIKAHPQFFNDQNFQQKVMAAANSAETIHGINHNNPRYFEMIEEAVGLRTAQQSATSGAATSQPRQSATVPPPPPPPPPPVARAAPSAAPSRSDPTPGATSDGRVVVLSAEEREHAHMLFPRRKPSDPDPELLYAKNKSLLIREGRLQV